MPARADEAPKQRRRRRAANGKTRARRRGGGAKRDAADRSPAREVSKARRRRGVSISPPPPTRPRFDAALLDAPYVPQVSVWLEATEEQRAWVSPWPSRSDGRVLSVPIHDVAD